MLVLVKQILRQLRVVSAEGCGDVHFYVLAGSVLDYCVHEIPNKKIRQLIRPLIDKCSKVQLSYLGYQIEQIHDMTEFVLSELSRTPID